MSAEHLNPVPDYYQRAIARLDVQVNQIKFVSKKISPFAEKQMRLADQIRTEIGIRPVYPEADTHLHTDHT